jgi:hypothetical protein
VAEKFQVRHKRLGRHQPEGVMVRAGTDGADDLVRLGGSEDELDVFRWFFDDLQQGVEPRGRDHVGLVNDEDFVAVPHGSIGGALAQVPRIIHTAMAGGVDLDDIQGAGPAARKLNAAGTGAAGGVRRALGAVQATRKDAGRCGFATAPGAGKKVGMVDPVFPQSRHERLGDMFLPDNVSKGVWTVSAVQGGSNCHRENPTNPG